MPYRQIGLICPSEPALFMVSYLKSLGFEVCALWTPEPELTIQAAAEHEIPFCASRPDDVLLRKEVQMIIITGRPQIHSQIALKALGIGKHVVCDCPVTLSNLDALKMVQAAQYYPQLLALVGFGLRHLEIFQKARRLIADGYIGSAVACECTVRTGTLLLPDRYDWMWEHSMGGGVLNLVGCHVIDLISFLTQRRAVRVQGLVKCTGLAACGSAAAESCPPPYKHDLPDTVDNSFRRVNADDFATLLLKFDNDFVATITLNALCKLEKASDDRQQSPNSGGTNNKMHFEQRLLISGSAGQLEIRDDCIYGSRFGDADCQRLELLYSGANSAPSSVVSTVVPELYVQGFRQLLRLLADTFTTAEQLQNRSSDLSWRTGYLASFASFEDAQYVCAVVDAVRYSSVKGDWVKVDYCQQKN